MLDKRLKLCADMVNGSRVCDVGTDHAYLIAELLSSGKCDTAVAADINEGPLSAARINLEKAGVTDKVDIILSDGLKGTAVRRPSKSMMWLKSHSKTGMTLL